MREFSVPAKVGVGAGADLTDAVWANAAEVPEHVVFSRRGSGGWQDVTAVSFRDDVIAVAKGLIAAGVQAGDRVGLMSKTRYEWTLVDYAIWAAGAVTVPVYETSSSEQLAWNLADSGAIAMVVETAEHAAAVEALRGELPELGSTWQLDSDGIGTLRELGRDVSDDEVAQRRATLGPDSLATIIYTSGTTGQPKGCELTHRNILFQVLTTTDGLSGLFNADGSTLLFLPLAHVFARLIQCGVVQTRTRMGHTADVKNLLPDLAAFRPTFILSVPRVFEKVYNVSKQRAHADGKGKIFDRADQVAVAYSRALDAGGPGVGLRAQHAVFDRLVYSKLRAALGGQCRSAISGGAPLGERLGHFFRGVGITVYEGYGLTETSAGACVNVQHALKIGTVGRAVPGVAVGIADDGEVLIKGDIVFRGYWNNVQATVEALNPDGWFHTGDIGDLDGDGFLRITGRKKELIVTAGGKNVAPAVLEDRLRAHPLVSQCMVVGDAQPFIGALVTIDPDAFPVWKQGHGKPANAAVSDLREDRDLIADIQQGVDEANKAVSKAEAIKKFRILPDDFTEEGGELTPSLKLKRNVVSKQYAEDIAALYS
ncbi:MAG: long-chain fatty acid--CoA ligase [Actinomycetota bacterium]|nr:long-chain fatty acid--CoA ligase [Actinomycetota bacterium]